MYPISASAQDGPDTAQPYTHDLCVFIGRFQPFHTAHQHVVEEALRRARYVLVLVGSAGAPRNHRNPFTFEERRDMIRLSFEPGLRSRLIIQPLEDCLYNDTQWVCMVQNAAARAIETIEHFEDLRAAAGLKRHGRASRVALIGHAKDNTSYYLKLFPRWDNIGITSQREGLSATRVRNIYYSNARDAFLANADGHRPGDLPQDHLLTSAVREFLIEFKATPAFVEIVGEYEFARDYAKQWAGTPYPVIFTTVDACVVQSGHILLIRRRSRPGKGLWALPGGFIKPDETLATAMLRELREETKLAVPGPVLQGSIVTSRVFDDPNRSSRGRTITHGFLIHLRPATSLPRIKGQAVKAELPEVEGCDDADKAQWFPLDQVTPGMMFEDHFSIIQALTAHI